MPLDVRYPTTEQLHAHSQLMQLLKYDWPYSDGTARALVPGASHEARLVQTGYAFFEKPAREKRRFKRRGTDVWFMHRVWVKLVLLDRSEYERTFIDVIAASWETWPTIGAADLPPERERIVWRG